MAQEGGLGIIHKNMAIEDQVSEVEKVKKYESGMITNPITLGPDLLVKNALDVMKKYGVSGVPITKNKSVKMIFIMSMNCCGSTAPAAAAAKSRPSGS